MFDEAPARMPKLLMPMPPQPSRLLRGSAGKTSGFLEAARCSVAYWTPAWTRSR
jgi:hypothetical protein